MAKTTKIIHQVLILQKCTLLMCFLNTFIRFYFNRFMNNLQGHVLFAQYPEYHTMSPL